MHGQASALGPGVGYVKEQIPRELALDVEVPLLYVRRFIAAGSCSEAVPLHVDQSLVSPERRSDSAWEGIGQRILGGNAIRLYREQIRIITVNEEVMRSIVPTTIHREVKHPITGSDDRVLVKLIGQTDTRADVVPRIEGAAARVLRGVHQIKGTLEIRQPGLRSNWTRSFRVKDDDSISPLRPGSLKVHTQP